MAVVWIWEGCDFRFRFLAFWPCGCTTPPFDSEPGGHKGQGVLGKYLSCCEQALWGRVCGFRPLAGDTWHCPSNSWLFSSILACKIAEVRIAGPVWCSKNHGMQLRSEQRQKKKMRDLSRPSVLLLWATNRTPYFLQYSKSYGATSSREPGRNKNQATRNPLLLEGVKDFSSCLYIVNPNPPRCDKLGTLPLTYPPVNTNSYVQLSGRPCYYLTSYKFVYNYT